jgi:[acyl-carrier-protein] S-malonyltransferase
MGKDVHDAFPLARETFEEAEDAAGLPLRRMLFDSSPGELRETQNAQLALVTHGAVMTALLRQHGDVEALAAAGHSVGEYAALHGARSLSLPSLIRLVQVRGNAMAESGVDQPGAMAALLGTPGISIADICARSSREGSVVVPANFNSPEQVVISGNLDAVERAMELATTAGVRKVVRLNVSGAFHSPLMQEAQGKLRDALADAEFADPAIPVYSNVTAEQCTTGADARSLLAQQLTSPVRWVELTRAIERDFPETVCLELGPGSVLAALVKRSAPSLRTSPCGTARDLDALQTVLA